MGIANLYSETKRFLKRWQESGGKSAVRNLLIYFNLLNVIQFREFRLMLACDIDHSRLPASTIFPHPVGIAIAGCTEIGNNVTIHQNVTIGIKDDGCPTICDGATIYGGAVVIGDIRVGEGAVVGPNAVVLNDVPDETTVVGVPASRVQNKQKESG